MAFSSRMKPQAKSEPAPPPPPTAEDEESDEVESVGDSDEDVPPLVTNREKEEQERKKQEEAEKRIKMIAEAEAESRTRAAAEARRASAAQEAEKRKKAEEERRRKAEQDREREMERRRAMNNRAQEEEEEKQRQARIARSKADTAARATRGMGGGGGGFGSGSGPGSGGFGWKKGQGQSSGGFKGFGPNARDLPSHDDSEQAVAAMVSRTVAGMKEGLGMLGLPEGPLIFTPGKELKLCGHNVREGINEMIHCWMSDERNEFYNVLLSIKNIVKDPIITQEEYDLLERREGWVRVPSGGYVRQEDAPAAAEDAESDDEVMDVPGAAKQPSMSMDRPAALKPSEDVRRTAEPKPAPAPARAAAAASEAPAEDLYQLLGVQPTASLQEIRIKFRQLVVTQHPEKGGDPKKFAMLNKAYSVLSDQEKRRQYDDGRPSASSKTFVD